MSRKPKKKQVDFSVRPRLNAPGLPATAEEWVHNGSEPAKSEKSEEGPQKRLTLNLPARVHTTFKGRCVVEGITIQDKVRMLIEQELGRQLDSQEPGPAEID